jgi:hypothetical protein
MGGSSTGTIGTTGVGGRGGGRGSGTGGRGGAPGRDGGPPPIDGGVNNPILSILPGVRPTPQCNQCVDVRCNSTTACSIDPQCLAGTECYFAVCASLPGQNQQFPCALKCFNGNLQLVTEALRAVSCVYQACGPQCLRGPEADPAP